MDDRMMITVIEDVISIDCASATLFKRCLHYRIGTVRVGESLLAIVVLDTLGMIARK